MTLSATLPSALTAVYTGFTRYAKQNHEKISIEDYNFKLTQAFNGFQELKKELTEVADKYNEPGFRLKIKSEVDRKKQGLLREVDRLFEVA